MKRAAAVIQHLTRTALAAAFLFSTGCAAHAHPHPHRHPRPAAKVMFVSPGHHHTARCGHYRHRGRWYYVKGHVHGPRCGHVWVRGVWRVK